MLLPYYKYKGVVGIIKLRVMCVQKQYQMQQVHKKKVTVL